MGEDASLHFYAALAHPNPVIPNMRVARNSIERGMRDLLDVQEGLTAEY